MGDGQNPPEKVLNQFTALNNELVGLHRDLARANAELTQLNERKNQMLGMAAHDLRNPLGAIRGLAESLLELPPEQVATVGRPVLERIVRSSGHMLALVDDLLTVSEIEAGRVRLDRDATDVVALVREIMQLEEPGASAKDIELELEVDGPVPEIPADEERLGQVVQNLVSNAVKYSPAGSTTSIAISTTPSEVVLTVSDQGVGIPDEELDDIFVPFARTSPRTTGGERSTGLGLAIAKRIVDAHDGRIDVRSTAGVGSTFTVRLPRQSPDVERTPSASSRDEGAVPGGSGSG